MMTKMTPYVFAQLLKSPNKQEDFYKSFLNKYRSKLDSTISIRFSSEKYTDVDVSSIFYDNFKEFVIEDLTSVKDDVLFDNWVYDLAERRVKKIRSKIDREAARILIQKGGPKNWRYACDIISREFQSTIKDVVMYCFNDDKYKGLKKNIPTILLALFFIERAGNPTPVVFRDSIESWLKTCLRNLANNKRKEIDKEIGVGDGHTVPIDSNPTGEVKDTNSFPPDSTECAIDNASHSSTDNTIEKETDSESVIEESLTEIDTMDSFQDDGAEKELKRLLSLMPNSEYAELIRAIKIEHVPVDVIAEEKDCTNAAIYNQMNEAMTMLVRVALPAIQRRCRKIYKRCVEHLESDYYKMILKEFFEDEKTIEELAIEHKKLPKAMSSDLVRAYKKIKEINSKLGPETFVADGVVTLVSQEIETLGLKTSVNEESYRKKKLKSFLLCKENISDKKAKDYLQKFLVEKRSISYLAKFYHESENSCWEFLSNALSLIK